MALRIVASRPDPAIITLPWPVPLEEWGEPYLVPLPRGLSRHVVRMVRLRDRIYAVKETVEDIAFREYRLLRDLQRLNLRSPTSPARSSRSTARFTTAGGRDRAVRRPARGRRGRRRGW